MLFLVASVVVGFIVGKWALVLPWVLVVALVVGIAIYFAYVNATFANADGESPLTALAFGLPNGVAAIVADLAIAVGILMRKGRAGGQPP